MAPDEVTLYGHWICPYSVRVSFALAERGIDHRLVDVPPTAVRPKGFHVPVAFVENSPQGEIPLVKVDGDYLADSIPILEWLEDRIDAPALLPADEAERAAVRAMMRRIDTEVFAPMVRIYYGIDPEKIARASDRLAEALSLLGDDLGARGWLVGQAPSLAEAVLVPLYVRLDGLWHLGFTGQLSAPIEAHAARTLALPGGRAVTWTDEMTDEFIGRFKTYRARRAGPA